MAQEFRTDEEQIEVIKTWWRENGRSTVVMIALALASVFGWQTWQAKQQESAEAAAGVYQELLESLGSQGEPQTDAQLATMTHLATSLQSDHAGSTYATFAGLQLAKTYVEKNELDKAHEQLQWVLDNRPDKLMEPLVRLRLARVVYAQSDAQAALDTITNVETGSYRAAYAEFRGDLYQSMGDFSKAALEYQAATESDDDSRGANQMLALKLKAVERLTPTEPAEPSSAAVEEASENAVSDIAKSVDAVAVDVEKAVVDTTEASDEANSEK